MEAGSAYHMADAFAPVMDPFDPKRRFGAFLRGVLDRHEILRTRFRRDRRRLCDRSCPAQVPPVF